MPSALLIKDFCQCAGNSRLLLLRGFWNPFHRKG
jgi:hypothetical protein